MTTGGLPWVRNAWRQGGRSARPPLFEITCIVLVQAAPALLLPFISLANALMFKVPGRALWPGILAVVAHPNWPCALPVMPARRR